ncbi:MAG: LapA family protein [Acidobacteria bacterium]|nr:LapA family protein [Acidobacteriota bacterium]
MKIKPRQIIILILVILCLVILFQNMEMVTIRLLFWNISMSRILMMMFFLMTGFFIGFFTSRPRDRPFRRNRFGRA